MSWSHADELPRFDFGLETGLAARVLPDDLRAGFAACSGDGEASLRWVIDTAIQSAVPGGDRRWADGGPGPLVDRAGIGALPSTSAMLAWLREAVPDNGPSWLECALTVESLAADGGLLASRCRSWAWAVWVDRSGRPRSAAAPCLEKLEVGGSGPDVGAEAGRERILFFPEAAATLIAATVRALQDPSVPSSLGIGPAWRVADDPTEERSPFGGGFDDAGFKAARKVLWDGREQTGRIDGPGHLRRASYRDAPAPMATTLVVEGPSPDAGAAVGTVVEDVRVHPLDPRTWILELAGMEAGGKAFERRMVTVDPWKIPERCVATTGPPRWSARGVLTPSLLFDGFSS